ncbi:hypothetical protein MMC18_001612 [Xylographa bjoerkii]|nr:hypothetical protein [Xylographa bjoerkii]
MPLPPLTFFRDDFRMTTWLLLGAFIQTLLVLSLPRLLALLPATVILSSRFVIATLKNNGVLRNERADGVAYGRMTTQIPNEDGTSSTKPGGKEICVFVLAMRSSHPKGRFGPGVKEMGVMFQDMWQDAAANRGKWGFLGKTPTMIASEDDCSNAMLWISYWKDLDHLQAFARGDAHRKGWDWYNATQHKHIGIQHETYSVPKEHWESIQYNMTPFGIANTQYPVADPGSADGTRFISPIQDTWKNQKDRMKDRMGLAESL